MNRHARDKVLMVLAVILCAAGIIMSLQTLNQTREKTKQIRDKIDRLETVRQFAAAAPASESAKAAFDSLDQHTPPELRRVINALLPNSTPVLTVREPVAARGDWDRHVADLKIRETSMENLARFIAGIESERPPWRLTGCKISATGNQPGIIRATLTVEALSK